MLSLHEHNEASRTAELVAHLRAGTSIALISDAGTPLICDPGYRVVAAVAREGLAVVPVPGACAAIAALCVAGLPTDRFTFEGFLPARGAARRSRLDALVTEERTMVFYEAPHRLIETLADLAAAFGTERAAVVTRELTKLHEQIYRGSLADLIGLAENDPNMSRGELVLVIAGAPVVASEALGSIAADRLLARLLSVMPLSQAVDLVADLSSERRNRIYDLALSLKSGR
jgi:16S rRNA (cytidine1402-2'-O)-methyltransferase